MIEIKFTCECADQFFFELRQLLRGEPETRQPELPLERSQEIKAAELEVCPPVPEEKAQAPRNFMTPGQVKYEKQKRGRKPGTKNKKNLNVQSPPVVASSPHQENEHLSGAPAQNNIVEAPAPKDPFAVPASGEPPQSVEPPELAVTHSQCVKAMQAVTDKHGTERGVPLIRQVLIRMGVNRLAEMKPEDYPKFHAAVLAI